MLGESQSPKSAGLPQPVSKSNQENIADHFDSFRAAFGQKHSPDASNLFRFPVFGLFILSL